MVMTWLCYKTKPWHKRLKNATSGLAALVLHSKIQIPRHHLVAMSKVRLVRYFSSLPPTVMMTRLGAAWCSQRCLMGCILTTSKHSIRLCSPNHDCQRLSCSLAHLLSCSLALLLSCSLALLLTCSPSFLCLGGLVHFGCCCCLLLPPLYVSNTKKIKKIRLFPLPSVLDGWLKCTNLHSICVSWVCCVDGVLFLLLVCGWCVCLVNVNGVVCLCFNFWMLMGSITIPTTGFLLLGTRIPGSLVGPH